MKRRLLSIFAALALVVNGAIAQELSVGEIEKYAAQQHTSIVVNISEATAMTALQFNLRLPEGLNFAQENDDYGIILGEATNDHSFSVSPLTSGEILIILYSMNSGTFSDGELLRIPVVTGLEPGITTGNIRIIRAATKDAESNVCDNVSFTATLKAVAIYEIELDRTSITLVEGETTTLSASVKPDKATNKTVTWVTSDEAVATVADGLVTAVAPGTATITAKAGDCSATCVVTVEAAAVEPEAPKVESGEYYLYNVEEKKFLSRGEYWGTCATVDRYGVPFVWTAEEYSLKFLDSNVCLFETDDSNLYTDNASTGFVFEYTEGGYLLKSQKSDRYLTIVDKAYTHQIVNVTDDATAATLWQPMTKAEHDAIVAGYVEENYASVIAAAGITATAGDFANYLATLTAVDVTDAIGTARFGGNAGEWTFTEIRRQDWQPAYGTDFCELWQATGYYTQTITGLTNGIYKVTMQGFERAGGWAVCKDLGDKGYEITTATLSANGEEVNLKSWYSEKSGDNNPNNTGEAVAKFGEGKYMNELYTYVGADGTLTITVNKPSHVGDNWMLFNNFTLTLYTTETGIEETTVNGQQTTVIYDLLGRKVTDTEHLKGIYIVGGRKVVIK